MMKTKLQELRKNYLKKTATPQEKVILNLEKKAISKGLGAALLGAATLGPMATMGAQAIQNALYRRRAEKNFPETLKKSPQLKNYGKKIVREHFEVLKDMAPRMSSTPLLAGPWLLRAMQFSEEGLTPAQLRDIMELEESRRRLSVRPELVGRTVGGIRAEE